MQMLRERLTPVVLLWLSAAFFFVAVLIGAASHYTPIPLHDMWNGYLDFNMRVDDGELIAWWEPHNEHRIVLSRILFWVDMHLFEGQVAFLIAANVFFLLSIVAVSLWLLHRSVSQKVYSVTAPFIACWLLFWSQQENLTWGFQSQFFMAYLFPLLAFLLFSRFVESRRNVFLLGAFICGIASAFSMANGILALPLLVLLALLARCSWRVVGLSIFIACVVNSAYFYNYHAPEGHGSLLDTLASQPTEFIKYILYYLGAPFYHMFYYAPALGRVFALTSGLLFVIASVYLSWRVIFSRPVTPTMLALVCFLIYLGATVFGTAGGRALFGASQAFSLRYSTPALMGWVVLVVLFISTRSVAKVSVLGRGVLVGLVVLMTPFQLKALFVDKSESYARNVAVAALAWQVRDEAQISYVFPFADWALAMANKASERQESIFSLPELASQSRPTSPLPLDNAVFSNRCSGYVDQLIPAPAMQQSYKVTGWIGNPAPQKFNTVYDHNGAVVGSVATGGLRPDVANSVDVNLGLSGFTGYFQVKGDQEFYIIDRVLNCHLPISLPQLPFRITPLGSDVENASMTNLLYTDLPGADYRRTTFDGFRVLGSYDQSDEDTGKVHLHVTKGMSIRLTTGPSVQGLTLSIDGDIYSMPNVNSWVNLVFDDASLPKEFEVVLSDEGVRWGEWFALALELP